MSVKLKSERQWVKEILERYTELENIGSLPFAQSEDWPEWVNNLAASFIGTTHPGVKVRNMKNWRAKDLGRFLARQYANVRVMYGEVPLNPQVWSEGEKCIDMMVKNAEQQNPNVAWAPLVKQQMDGLTKLQPMHLKFIQEAVASACGRPYPQACAFFEAFGKAMVIKPDDLLAERMLGVGDKIIWAMFMNWRSIERLQSVAQLHHVFEQALKPHGVVVKYKRIEKLCQRIKLKFREGGGRPPGSKNSDKSLRSLGVI